MTYVEKAERGLLQKSAEMRKRLIAEGWLPDGVERVAVWEGVVSWVEEYEQGKR